MKTHTYGVQVRWTGNDGEGTRSYRSYRRDHEVLGRGPTPILASSDPAFRGDPERTNPEELLVAALSGCHLLWYLHLCAVNNIVVTAYHDHASGTMVEEAGGTGRFTAATLRPTVTIEPHGDASRAAALHAEAHQLCFVARSVNFPVTVEPRITGQSAGDPG